MKRFGKIGCLGVIALVVIMVIIVAVSGGGEEATPEPATNTGTSETTPAEAPAEEPAEAPAEEVKGIGESLKVGDVVYTVNSRTEATNVGGEFGQSAKGKYLVLDVTVKNEGNEALLVDTSLFKLVSGDKTYEADGTASMYANEQTDFFLSEINPDLEIKGNVVFDIPAEMHQSELNLNVQTGFFGTETGTIALQ